MWKQPAPMSMRFSRFTRIRFATAWVRGEVASVTAAECIGGGSCVDVVFEVTEGPDEGTFLAQSFPVGTADLEVGVAVYLSFTEGADPAFAYAYADVARGWTLMWAAVNGLEEDEAATAMLGGVFMGESDLGVGALRDPAVRTSGPEKLNLILAVQEAIEYVSKRIFPVLGAK